MMINNIITGIVPGSNDELSLSKKPDLSVDSKNELKAKITDGTVIPKTNLGERNDSIEIKNAEVKRSDAFENMAAKNDVMFEKDSARESLSMSEAEEDLSSDMADELHSYKFDGTHTTLNTIAKPSSEEVVKRKAADIFEKRPELLNRFGDFGDSMCQLNAGKRMWSLLKLNYSIPSLDEDKQLTLKRLAIPRDHAKLQDVNKINQSLADITKKQDGDDNQYNVLHPAELVVLDDATKELSKNIGEPACILCDTFSREQNMPYKVKAKSEGSSLPMFHTVVLFRPANSNVVHVIDPNKAKFAEFHGEKLEKLFSGVGEASDSLSFNFKNENKLDIFTSKTLVIAKNVKEHHITKDTIYQGDSIPGKCLEAASKTDYAPDCIEIGLKLSQELLCASGDSLEEKMPALKKEFSTYPAKENLYLEKKPKNEKGVVRFLTPADAFKPLDIKVRHARIMEEVEKYHRVLITAKEEKARAKAEAQRKKLELRAAKNAKKMQVKAQLRLEDTSAA